MNSALIVNDGVEQPPMVNPHVERLFKKRRQPLPTVEEYIQGIREGNITMLSRAITLIESRHPGHQQTAQKVLEACRPLSGNSIRLGITGVPGAGKSTFIETFGGMITSRNHRLAVLAIDPGSERSKGSILGDKTRMETLSADPRAFIRPSPGTGSLGGVARKTYETVILCEAAGFDYIFIETIGVGQSEVAVHSMTDFFLLLMISGAGDELQGIKRGVMEMSDLLLINKADGSNVEKAIQAQAQYQSALHLFPAPPSGWTPHALTCSAVEKTGLNEVLQEIENYVTLTKANGYFEQRRREQARYRMYETINESLQNRFYNNATVTAKLAELEQQVINGALNPYDAAAQLLALQSN
ncbi:MAG: methylmalonyl Co-A mutase-associated GTPase MeaB [Prevotellaceae bacterium]|jgi:LAO/AO transport system kinase|nr:methylmalonyl Co-A mutase-associated GTPase MeaB [Prevotellaceae bacterium]